MDIFKKKQKKNQAGPFWGCPCCNKFGIGSHSCSFSRVKEHNRRKARRELKREDRKKFEKYTHEWR